MNIVQIQTYRNIPNPDELWQHYKGGIYKILFIGADTETDKKCVVYENIVDPSPRKVWIRPLESFMGKVSYEEEGGMVITDRFMLVERPMEKEMDELS